MLIEVACKFCSSKHFDHYECTCGKRFGFLRPEGNFCNNCGKPFDDDEEKKDG